QKLNSGPLEELQVPLTAELTLQPSLFSFLIEKNNSNHNLDLIFPDQDVELSAPSPAPCLPARCHVLP
ncbi:hypothetical protein LEMLEM_LOCUS8137, partial [Lemmus lemmus]